MEQHFTRLPDNAKVWIYQSNRVFDEKEADRINALIREFIHQWASHSRKVIADGAVLYNRFVVLAADESAFTVSGCSIDSSVNFIRQLQEQFNADFFNRLSVAFLKDEVVQTVTQSAFQQLIDSGEVNENTIVFNNLVTTLADFRQNWQIPFAKSWHRRFFKMSASPA